MIVVVGLGNPGEKYENTRHNVGFMVTSALAEKFNINGKSDKKFNAIIGKGTIAGEEAIIVQPLTFMNLSGEAVGKILSYYKADKKNLLVVFDDLSLDLGVLRFRKQGSDGGHNGIKSIIKHLSGQNDFSRLKVGIGPQPPFLASENFVLQKFDKSEEQKLKEVVDICVDAVEFYAKNGADASMNKFNGISV